jgi:hypothetical protein
MTQQALFDQALTRAMRALDKRAASLDKLLVDQDEFARQYAAAECEEGLADQDDR